VNNIMRV